MPTNYTQSTNMLLPVPIVGVATGPTWATLLDQCLSIIDGHTHTAGSGVPITPDAININSTLQTGNQLLASAKALSFTSQVSTLPTSGSTLQALYCTGVDLYFNDGSGNAVRITQSGGVAGSPGSISSLTAPASASYSSAASTFTWQSDANIAANMDFAAAVMRNISPNSTYAVTLSPPASLAANYSLTLPAAVGSTKIMTLDSSGNMAGSYTVDGTTIAISANVIGVPNGGINAAQIGSGQITTAKIADLAVTAAKIANATITTAKISASAGIVGTQLADATISGTQINTSVNLNGLNSRVASKPIVTSNTASGVVLSVVRGVIGSSGSIVSGDGFTVSHPSTGVYTITWSAAFADVPAVTITSRDAGSGLVVGIAVPSNTTTCPVTWYDTGALANTNFNFIAIGQRAT